VINKCVTSSPSSLWWHWQAAGWSLLLRCGSLQSRRVCGLLPPWWTRTHLLNYKQTQSHALSLIHYIKYKLIQKHVNVCLRRIRTTPAELQARMTSARLRSVVIGWWKNYIRNVIPILFIFLLQYYHFILCHFLTHFTHFRCCVSINWKHNNNLNNRHHRHTYNSFSRDAVPWAFRFLKKTTDSTLKAVRKWTKLAL